MDNQLAPSLPGPTCPERLARLAVIVLLDVILIPFWRFSVTHNWYRVYWTSSTNHQQMCTYLFLTQALDCQVLDHPIMPPKTTSCTIVGWLNDLAGSLILIVLPWTLIVILIIPRKQLTPYYLSGPNANSRICHLITSVLLAIAVSLTVALYALWDNCSYDWANRLGFTLDTVSYQSTMAVYPPVALALLALVMIAIIYCHSKAGSDKDDTEHDYQLV